MANAWVSLKEREKEKAYFDYFAMQKRTWLLFGMVKIKWKEICSICHSFNAWIRLFQPCLLMVMRFMFFFRPKWRPWQWLSDFSFSCSICRHRHRLPLMYRVECLFSLHSILIFHPNVAKRHFFRRVFFFIFKITFHVHLFWFYFASSLFFSVFLFRFRNRTPLCFCIIPFDFLHLFSRMAMVIATAM